MAPGAQISIAATGSDSDHWTQGTSNGDEADGVTFSWSASGGQLASSSGPNVDWTAPSAEDSYTLTCTVDDVGTTRYNDDAKSASVTIVVDSSAPTLSLDSSQSTLCAGGGTQSYNQSEITVTLKDADGQPLTNKTLSLSCTPETAPLSATTVTTDATGKATVMLPTWAEVGPVKVIAAYAGVQNSTTIDIQAPEGEVNPNFEYLETGTGATADVQWPLTFRGEAVTGHSISWRISKVWNADGAEVAAPFDGYGSIAPLSTTTGADGIAHTTYTVGTLGGSIEFEGTDNDVLVDEETTGASNATVEPQDAQLSAFAPAKAKTAWKKKGTSSNPSAGTTPKVMIEINNTPATTDDLVRLGSSVPCRAKVTGTPPQDWTIVLTNPDGRLRFGGATKQTRTLPKNGNWVAFSITGQTGSDKVGDAKIQARKSVATGEIKLTKDTSVWDLINPSIVATPQNDYAIQPNGFFRPVGDAITVTAKITLKPSGLDTSVPQLARYRLGIQQNVSGGWNWSHTYGNATVTWGTGAPRDSTVSLPLSVTVNTTGPTFLSNDTSSEAEVFPFFETPVPLSSTGETECARGDFPGPSRPYVESVMAGNWGTIRYTGVVSATMNETFLDWAVLAEYEAEKLVNRTNLAETSWNLNIGSEAPRAKRANGGASGPVVNTPVDTPITNDLPKAETIVEGPEGDFRTPK